MKPPDRRLILAIALVGLALAAWMGLSVVMVWSTLESAERKTVGAVLGPRMALLGMGWVAALVGAAYVLNLLHRRYAHAPARLLEQTRVLLASREPQPLIPDGSAELRDLAGAINELAAQRDRLREDVAQQITEASRSVQQEKNRLAALMSELTQSVVVCNLDGRILLYNSRARMQFRALSEAPTLADGAELMGLGRSIYAVFDRQLVAHALETIHQRLRRGVASPSAQFVTTTRTGQLLRAQMAPVRDQASGTEPGAGISGFVLMLDNVTQRFEDESLRDRLLHGLTEGSRSSLANMQAAVDMLGYADLEPAMRERFLAVVKEEVSAMSQRITDLVQRSTQGLKTRWPLEEMLGTDFVTAAQRQIEAHCRRAVTLEGADASLWLKVESFTLLQALTYLAGRLVDEFDVKFLQLRLQQAGPRAQLDLVWSGRVMSTETVMTWEMDPMRFGAHSTPLTVRDVVERHGGEMWFERERVRHQAFFRFLLPLASAQEQLEAAQIMHNESRPEYYDFDLFQVSEQGSALDDQQLSSLSFTVFDTETTGLNPSEGDEIVQIGAARIVNGKLLRQESFEQLVDPGRVISAASIPIHGITQEMVRGKPRIAEVLPAFHAFAQDTVLVAHNAAFDMKFLQLQEARTGIAFHQPVLDTLLLSAVVHPNQESHRLEAIAERFNITVLGRHTALGDAMVTAEVLLRLLPLLQAMGIHTLRQAREAAQATYYARLKY
ncbi:exonuclease domain-containing protein [Polaromonas sp.]|uniref:3'-5' exonuclease n=1 Tax=Polaromonas sp. TaxID=1869339 RepID=UPI001DA59707|nr:exonuclease domain-containing protein [Polaromonas sp.]MBT9476715.1 DNA polymerase III subunit epsilon [Polaromonas sp.]